MASEHDDACAFVKAGTGDAGANASASTGNDDEFVFKSEVHINRSSQNWAVYVLNLSC